MMRLARTEIINNRGSGIPFGHLREIGLTYSIYRVIGMHLQLAWHLDQAVICSARG